MPGYELIDKKEFEQVSEIFRKSKTLFRMGFDKQRKGIFKVKDFENSFAKKLKSKYYSAGSAKSELGAFWSVPKAEGLIGL